MKQTCLFFAVLLLLMAPRLASAQETAPESEVRDAVSTFGRAFEEADVSTLRTLLTEDYVHVNGGSGSVLNREEWLNWVASRRRELDRGELVIDTYRVEEVEIQVYGEASVVTGVVHSRGQRNGASFTIQVRFTNVWVQQDEVWRRAAFHDSPVPASEP